MKNKDKEQPAKSGIGTLMLGLRSMVPADRMSWALVLLGMTASTTLSVLIRESLNLFGGNEFLIGAQLFACLVMLGLGAGLGTHAFTRFIKNDPIAWGFMFLSFSPVLSLLILHYGQSLLFVQADTADFWGLTLLSIISQAPVMVLIGVMFTHFVAVLRENGKTDALLSGLGWKGMGFLLGGLLLLAFQISLLKNTQVLMILSMINLAFGWTMVFSNRKILPNLFAFVLNVTLLSLIFAINFQATLSGSHLKSATKILQKETPYGQLTITGEPQQQVFYTGTTAYVPLRDSNSIAESVHYTLLQHYNPQNVLLVSGAASGYAEEIMKYKPKVLDVLEVNPAMLSEGLGFVNPIPGIKYIKEDPAEYLLHCTTMYDVVLLVLPNPSNIQLNRYYTLEFFKNLKDKLNDGAYVYVKLDKNDKLSESQTNDLNSMVFYAMKKVFRRTILIPGTTNHLIATEREISIRLAAKAMDKGIETKVIAGDPVSDSLLRKRIETSMGKLSTTIKLNRIFHPGAFFTLVGAGMPLMNPMTIFFLIFLSLLVALYLFKGKGRRISVFLTGFTMLSLIILLLMSFQAMFGSLYLMAGLLLGFFAVGTVAGIKLYLNMEAKESAPAIPALQVAVGSFGIIVLFFLLGIREVTSSLVLTQGLFFLLMLIGGLITGLQFTAISHKEPAGDKNTADGLYLALILGAAVGTLLASVLFFPMLGLILSCIILGVLNAAIGFLFY